MASLVVAQGQVKRALSSQGIKIEFVGEKKTEVIHSATYRLSGRAGFNLPKVEGYAISYDDAADVLTLVKVNAVVTTLISQLQSQLLGRKIGIQGYTDSSITISVAASKKADKVGITRIVAGTAMKVFSGGAFIRGNQVQGSMEYTITPGKKV